MKLFRDITIFLSALLFTGLVQAHTALKESTPANEATVATAPQDITLVFNGPVRLVKLELMVMGQKMNTSFKPASEAIATYVVETPGMHAGEFTVNWAAIGADGHTVSNSFSFTVDPAATNSAP